MYSAAGRENLKNYGPFHGATYFCEVSPVDALEQIATVSPSMDYEQFINGGKGKMTEAFLTYMEGKGWAVERKTEQELCLPELVKSRYAPGFPESWIRFVSGLKSMVRRDEAAWFLCAEDYDARGDKAWQWNEWELMSLEAAEGDTAWAEEIRMFWDGHFPFFLSLEDGYAYYAISMKDSSVVYGTEPEFEECRTVADSFDDFMEKAMRGMIRL